MPSSNPPPDRFQREIDDIIRLAERRLEHQSFGHRMRRQTRKIGGAVGGISLHLPSAETLGGLGLAFLMLAWFFSLGLLNLRIITLIEPRAHRGDQELRATGVGVDLAAKKIYLTNGFSTGDPMVVARAIGENGADGGVNFAVESAVKGNPPATFLLPGTRLDPPPRSDPSQPQVAYSDGGSCTRTVFKKGDRSILFLSRSPGGRWEKLHFTFADQDYEGEQSSSMRTIRTR